MGVLITRLVENATSNAVGSRSFTRLETVGGMGKMAVGVVRTAFTTRGWFDEALEEASAASKRSFGPLLLSHFVYLVGFGILLFGLVVANLGLLDREGGFVNIVWTREISTWVTGMVFAGVVGSAMAADLGARKIREELDALAVLGVPTMRTLVLPRVAALTMVAPVLAMVSLVIVSSVNLLLAPPVLGFSRGVWIDSWVMSLHSTDVFFVVVLKMTIIGFFVGVVSCYKGLTTSAGAEGVGRAVNETVVLTFLGIWLINSVFNLAYGALFPAASAMRG
ncbi:hypothetical protein DSM112329_04230 [Paraconexibacter sp. AEG42_29]|uniref:ABC transporter permease n=1 Tax=Paraconexibacter sp. AEG42_29 TaxID=2997339 RepID=A0AAU7B0B2_9ACTN